MKVSKILLFIISFSLFAPSVAFNRRRRNEQDEILQKVKKFVISSPSFARGGDIPRYFTCDGKDVSPELLWEGVPLGTQSYVLIMHDPDALGGNWYHWIMYNIDGDNRRLAQQISAVGIDAKLGVNSWGDKKYGGPCPPLKKHRYVFTLYALNTPKIDPGKNPDARKVKKAIHGHILGKASYMGRYQRPKNK